MYVWGRPRNDLCSQIDLLAHGIHFYQIYSKKRIEVNKK